MNLFLISYDLRNVGQNYNDLYLAIKQLGEWQHPLESTWVIKSDNQTVESIYATLRARMDDNDSLLIVDITNKSRQGWMPKTFWAWLNS